MQRGRLSQKSINGEPYTDFASLLRGPRGTPYTLRREKKVSLESFFDKLFMLARRSRSDVLSTAVAPVPTCY